ncbi:MAG: NADH-quinone oxidoreductase subunit D [Dermatophilaceae bacterium]
MTSVGSGVLHAVIGTGPDALVHADLMLSLGPHHPANHGSLRLRVSVAGERVVAAEPLVGLLHRGAEKLFEVRDYRQILVLANRHDWLAAFAGELGACLVVEEALGLPVPPRAVWIRMLLAELTRVSSHLAFLAAFPTEVGTAPVATPNPLRESLLAVFEELSGARMHLMVAQLGGLREDLPAGWTGRARHTVAAVRAGLPQLVGRLDTPEVRSRTEGVGVLSPEQVHSYGVSGAMARASGVDIDVRRDEPYLGYAELFAEGGPGRVVTRSGADAAARLHVLAEQVEVALDLAEACLDRLASLPPGPVAVRLPKVVRVPEGEWYRATETPLGMAGYYLVSRGGPTPWRLKLRSASFGNVAVLAELLPGCHLSDLQTVVASCCFGIGDVDR